MIRRLFIANRGEIALRITHTARRMGIETILGVSEADRTSLPARMADHVVLLGPAPSSQSYLDVDRVVAAAAGAKADAVHPGYGFLSENSRFARAVAAAGMIFIGPSPESLDAMGDKLKARAVGLAAGMAVVPGGEAEDREAARRRANETGYPLLIKAVSGGGGRGMKRVNRDDELDSQIALAMAEAQAAFGDPRIYIERYIARGRHVEVQVLGDGRRAIHLGTRDCSIQRRFQKLVEEAPAPDIPEERHEALRAAAVRLAEYLGYSGAGTVEYLVDAESFDFYFLEMNARIQVEHPVTEAVTGIDLVEQQLLIADRQPLGIAQDDVKVTGHAIEVRINAEDWTADFRPSPGKVARAAWPAGPGIRVDTHIESGGAVPPYYDSLMGKLIVQGAGRREAIARMAAALDTLEIDGVASTAPMHRAIMADPRFAAGAVDTRFFEELARG
ncbi:MULTISPECIES: acetyl-CoA carboxylase biotin carboxylase subunit [unclassified Sphingomonas]|uniref:acetyl-CoA carboxylase biotin carboxylase subunit n=1 Tax=unclassified Sphingomonas TaxID=196159 RepID=UPI0007003664|nr:MULTISPECIES: biotin carboxylase N-terminal domain-containing protein [unclassified Sphingomonas]KRB78785.1 acetyl-CoA carboxylase biotin carboxylase subunit [Sphingomonas sp. Root710]KRB93695.1 acetyl-CoA carboxylase biotin carboxylase subunit [Sphingomonas sp. Root720]